MRGKRKTILEMSGDILLPVKRMSIVPVNMVVDMISSTMATIVPCLKTKSQ